MNAETLSAMPEGAKLMMRVGLMSELEKMRTLRMGALRACAHGIRRLDRRWTDARMYNLAAVFSLFAYDVLTTLGTERRVMWSKKPSIMGFLYFCCRCAIQLGGTL